MRKTLICLLAAALVFSSAAVNPAAAAIDNNVEAEVLTEDGNLCGDNLEWSVSDEGVLTISGSGDMYDFLEEEDYPGTAPWTEYQEDITSVVIAEGVESIGAYAFYGYDRITSISIASTVTKIGEGAFALTSISSVDFPEGLSEIPALLFWGCESLESIVIPDNVTAIGYRAFSDCESLVDVTLSSNLTDLGDAAFIYCFELTDVVLPDSLTRIGGHAFDTCESITALHIPESVTEIGEGAFYECSNLAEINIPDGVTVIEDYTFGGIAISEITIPAGVTSIGEGAIGACYNLVSVNFEEGSVLTDIKKAAFLGDTALPSIEFPEKVNFIGLNAFKGCSSLHEVIFTGNAPKSMMATAFSDVTANVYYTPGDSRWNLLKKYQFGGNLTWISIFCKDGHSWDEGVVTKEASETEDGEILYTCSVCGETKTLVIPRIIKPTASIRAERGSSSCKVVLTGTLNDYGNISDKYTVTAHGLLYMTTARLGAKSLLINSTGRTRVNFSSYKADGSFSYTFSASKATTKYVARTFIVYTDENGKSVTVYSDPIYFTYNSLAK